MKRHSSFLLVPAAAATFFSLMGKADNFTNVRTAEVLDDQNDDTEQQDFSKTIRFSLGDMPCPRPASVSLRTAPRFFYTLTIPKKAGA